MKYRTCSHLRMLGTLQIVWIGFISVGALTGAGRVSASVFYRPQQTIVQSALIAVDPPDVNVPTFQMTLDQFVTDSVAKYGLDQDVVRHTLSQAVFQPSIVIAMQRPAERTKLWSEYRELFLTEKRIEGGQQFLKANEAVLNKMVRRTAVPAEMITAIIGVETQYGANTGHYRVLDALYTLAFGYPVRSDRAFYAADTQRELYFRDELAQFLALCRDEHLSALDLKGSYAGAMGMGQFMPSSYRSYALDGDGDGRRDLLANTADVVFSIANYLNKKGSWQSGEPVAVPAKLDPGHTPIESDNLAAMYSLSALSAQGYHPLGPVKNGLLATPLTFHNAQGDEYWLGFNNFYAITHYNSSPLYAMAVFQLSQAIANQGRTPP